MSFRRGILQAWEGNPSSPAWSRMLTKSLGPLGSLYGVAMAHRRRRYEAEKAGVFKIPVPVISIGNLALGGTGKTPTVAWLVKKLILKGHKPAVVSRGYGGRPKDVMVVGDGKGSLMAAPPAADEAAMLARRYSDLLVLTGSERSFVAKKAVEEFGADVIVLDDGFQHLALHRDMDVVVLRGDSPFGNGKVVPAGVLREPVSALKRADAVLLTGECAGRTREEIQAFIPDIPMFTGHLEPDTLLDSRGENTGSPDELKGARVVVVSGLGNPYGFEKMLESLDVEVMVHHEYPDHAHYALADGVRLVSSIQKTGADFILTTEKDAVKLSPLLSNAPLRVLRVVMKIDDEMNLAGLIEKKVFSS
ncbi:MAG: tetraacyldisaccharide 4'-kinase [Nitrospinae bacterium]|nr:tetraacyldisaccharide 4'-kinase [Nitrospinota bacterium]